MSRYKALRAMGCDPLTAASVSLMNWINKVPCGTIRILNMTIEYTP